MTVSLEIIFGLIAAAATITTVTWMLRNGVKRDGKVEGIAAHKLESMDGKLDNIQQGMDNIAAKLEDTRERIVVVETCLDFHGLFNKVGRRSRDVTESD